MKYFDEYVSNTLAGSANQLFFETDDENKVSTGRVFYKIFSGGEYEYSILFSNVIDSTFGYGDVGKANRIIDGWCIEGAKIGKSKTCDMEKMTEPYDFVPLLFDGKPKKSVAPGEFFASDSVRLNFEKDEYLCLEISFKGKEIPYHPESLLPSFVINGEKWEPSKLHPFAAMIGVKRKVKERVVFFGDSITQGIGSPENSYKHWSAVVSEGLGEDYSFWNLGIGCGRASDAASLGAWTFKAQNAETVVVCFGVNDIIMNYTEAEIKQNLFIIVSEFKKMGKKVVVQTVPPFDYKGERIAVFKGVNNYIKTELIKEADTVFDAADVLKKSDEEPEAAKYGGHPDALGSEKWAEKLLPVLKDILS